MFVWYARNRKFEIHDAAMEDTGAFFASFACLQVGLFLFQLSCGCAFIHRLHVEES